MELLMTITATATFIIGCIYLKLKRREWHRKRAKQIERESLIDMERKCSYAITQEIIHERFGKNLDRFTDFYKEICVTMNDFRENKMEFQNYKNLKLSFYRFYEDCGLPNF